jgi:hypothetical protein
MSKRTSRGSHHSDTGRATRGSCQIPLPRSRCRRASAVRARCARTLGTSQMIRLRRTGYYPPLSAPSSKNERAEPPPPIGLYPPIAPSIFHLQKTSLDTVPPLFSSCPPKSPRPGIFILRPPAPRTCAPRRDVTRHAKPTFNAGDRPCLHYTTHC